MQSFDLPKLSIIILGNSRSFHHAIDVGRSTIVDDVGFVEKRHSRVREDVIIAAENLLAETVNSAETEFISQSRGQFLKLWNEADRVTAARSVKLHDPDVGRVGHGIIKVRCIQNSDIELVLIKLMRGLCKTKDHRNH